GNTCADTQNDPLNCNTCGTACSAAQACIGAACSCRPGLTVCGVSAACTDLLHDTANCGACGHACGALQRCVDGACQAATVGCGTGRTNCNGGCYTAAQLAASPLHCSAIAGTCGQACNANQVCAQGTCTTFFTSTSCTTCPCPACGTGTTCCSYPGTAEAICVEGSVCPQ